MKKHIEVTNIEVNGFEAAIRGMRNPMNSWELSDSYFYDEKLFMLGAKDKLLASTLAKAGSTHGKFMRMITISADVTAPLYWWKEFDTYKVGTVANSCSTMHKLLSKPFAVADFVPGELTDGLEIPYKDIVRTLNIWRDFAQDNTKTVENRTAAWRGIVSMLPSGYLQKRTILFNYEVLRRIVLDRKNHKLVEWHEFIEAFKRIPYYFELIDNTSVKLDDMETEYCNHDVNEVVNMMNKNNNTTDFSFIVTNTDEADAWNLVSEEASELAAIAAKAARKINGSSPTPVAWDDIIAKISEEAADVQLCLDVALEKSDVDISDDVLDVRQQKIDRWVNRLDNVKADSPKDYCNIFASPDTSTFSATIEPSQDTKNFIDNILASISADKNQKTSEKIDVVNPAHYKDFSSIECIDVMRLIFGQETVCNYCLVNAFKYIWRYKHKNGKEDLEKASWYMDYYKVNAEQYENIDTATILEELLDVAMANND